MRRHRLSAAITLGLFLFGTSGLAQARDDAQCTHASSSGANQRDQTFCFAGEDVQTSLVGHSGQGVQLLRPPRGVSLIRIRAHFVPEMMRSVENQ